MFARVTTFEGDPARIEEIATWLRDTAVPMGREQFEGYRGVMLVADRDTGKGKTLAFWDSEQALHASEEAASQLRDERNAAWGGIVVGVDRYEVVVDDRRQDGGTMFARVTMMAGDPARVEDAVVYTREKVLPIARKLVGNRGMLSLVDRKAGTGMSLTFWNSMEAMQASEEAANRVRGDASATLDREIVGVDRFEVVLDERF